MKNEISIEFERPGIRCDIEGNIAILTLSCDIYKILLDLEIGSQIFDWYDAVEQSELKGVLIINEPECLGEKCYTSFLSDVAGLEITPDNPVGITKFMKENVRAVEINMLSNFIHKTAIFSKIIVTALQGDIVSPFFGASLTSDFRYVNEETIIKLTHNKYGLHASGALPFFLPKFFKRTKAMEYLLLGGEINAEAAYKMDLVNEILPSKNFRQNCIEKTNEICKMSLQYVKTTKALAGTYKDDLEKYLMLESSYILK